MRILLGVTGGIAAYKAVEILRLLQESGAEVEVAMTRSARRFITLLTFSSLTGKPVHTSLWTPQLPPTPDAPIEHITLAQRIDALLIAPATANTLARLAHGFAPDLLSTVALATTAPLILAPAMNVVMWNHPATQANLHTLTTRGAHIIPPDAGHLACGMTGAGRLADPGAIVAATLATITNNQQQQDLAAETLLITAGGTREPLDPVRFLGNRSSGRMGHVLAAAALARGARVHLITASPLPAPPGCEVTRIDTAEQMSQALDSLLPHATVLIAAAAVADFRPSTPSPTKLRRTAGHLETPGEPPASGSATLTLTLESTPDLVARAVERRRPGTIILAFAAETIDPANPDALAALEALARAKLLRKGADAIIANNVADPSIGFESDRNAGLFLTPTQTIPLPFQPKLLFAHRILDNLVTLRTTPAGRRPPYGDTPLATG